MKKILMAIALGSGISMAARADSAPAYPGGEVAMEEYIATNMKYPSTAQDNGIEGVVTLEVEIKSDGTVGKIKIVRMLDPDLEQEAIRLVKTMPAWTPANKGGQNVDQTVTIPVKFTLPE